MSWRQRVLPPTLIPLRGSLTVRLAHSPPGTSDAAPSASPRPLPPGSVSAKLWADALEEEEPAPSKRVQQLLNKEDNWTGDERIEDTVLRMLVDKYKPLRSGTIQSAEEKIRARKDDVAAFVPVEQPFASTSTITVTPTPKAVIDPATHRPWHTTFRPPSHATLPQVKYGNPIKSTPNKTPTLPQAALADPRLRAAVRIAKKRVETAGRITRARESTLDYRLGARSAGGAGKGENPTSLRGWTSLIEDRIEQARLAGHFNNLNGRGKPIVRDLEERNPFLGREEFFMNRIVKRNGAAPPWIELQREVDDALSTFRRIVQEGWIRRATRMLTLSYPPNALRHMTPQDASRFRDAEWEQRESGYHSTAIEELNSLIRKYNAFAPYTVRRTYVTKEAELARVFDLSGERIASSFKNFYGIGTRASNVSGAAVADEADDNGSGGSVGTESTSAAVPFSLRLLLTRWMSKIFWRRSQL
ncbi:hypothetical protein CALVIDRAFT_476423 [Calocera viscosa TUFC12733]|uniref:DnaJ homologue subfamily C member 28 conserved domain-containing protein n=1 Tax=Calocera viscosa (strain TUFC12733) TaxID=1330018 RepID=A0A167QWC4_CALVF|nr:hypothetical protein CALVIDRAFT_476423 [Calocera viscosa TUFC12733]